MMDELMEMVEACGTDVEFDGSEILFEDGGYTEDGEEVECEYEHAEEVHALVEWLDTHCIGYTDGYYAVYHFDGFDITIAYASMDI